MSTLSPGRMVGPHNAYEAEKWDGGMFVRERRLEYECRRLGRTEFAVRTTSVSVVGSNVVP
jgi:hypothetical protein